jgi:hypothetical protein
MFWLVVALIVAVGVAGGAIIAANERPCLAGHHETRRVPARTEVQVITNPDSNGGIVTHPILVAVPEHDVDDFVCDEWGAP